MTPFQMQLLSALTALILTQTAWAESGSAAQSAEALYKRSTDVSLWRANATPYVLVGSFKLHGLASDTTDGLYRMVWFDSQHWREDIGVPGFSQIRAVNGDTAWRQRTTAYLPYRISQVISLVEGASAGFTPSAWVKDATVKEVKVDANGDSCVTLTQSSGNSSRVMCFEKATGALVSESFDGAVQRTQGKFQAVGNGVFPSELSAFQYGKLAVEFKVTELTVTPLPSQELLNQPAEAKPWVWCEEMRHYELPRATLTELISGIKKETVNVTLKQQHGLPRPTPQDTIVSGVLGTDGKVHDATIEQRASNGFDDASLKAVRNMTSTPATCQGKAVEVDFSFPLRFRVR